MEKIFSFPELNRSFAVGPYLPGCQCAECVQRRRYPQWNPRTLAGTDDAATATRRVLDQLREQMRNTPPRTRRPIRPTRPWAYWQFKNGKTAPMTHADGSPFAVNGIRTYMAWDRSLGALVEYAAQ